MKTIAEDDVTTISVLRLLRKIYLDAALDSDGDIYVRDGITIPCWIKIIPDKRLLQFFTYMDFSGSDFDDCSIFEVASRLNSDIAVPTFFGVGERIYGSYFLTYAGGVAKRQLVSMLRRFSGAFDAGIRLADISPPGALEADGRRRLHS